MRSRRPELPPLAQGRRNEKTDAAGAAHRRRGHRTSDAPAASPARARRRPVPAASC